MAFVATTICEERDRRGAVGIYRQLLDNLRRLNILGLTRLLGLSQMLKIVLQLVKNTFKFPIQEFSLNSVMRGSCCLSISLPPSSTQKGSCLVAGRKVGSMRELLCQSGRLHADVDSSTEPVIADLLSHTTSKRGSIPHPCSLFPCSRQILLRASMWKPSPTFINLHCALPP